MPSDLSTVDLVEKLHEYEHLEDHSVVEKFLGPCSIVCFEVAWQNEFIFTFIKSWAIDINCSIFGRSYVWSLIVDKAGELLE